MFEVCWQAHGGSGLSCDVATAYDMGLDEIRAFHALIQQRRKDEAAAIKRASERGRR